MDRSAHAFLIAGSGGMLGTALQRVFTARGERCEAPPESAFDITDEATVRHVIDEFASGLGPGEDGVLVNAAAYTNVERAEDEPEIAHLVNARAPGVLAIAARDAGVRFVHVSTDFVFDGTKQGAYVEDDAPNPLSVYGASKLAGELAVQDANPAALVVRTAWVFGPAGVNFPVKILDAARTRPSLSVVTDEIGSPTYTIDLAAGIVGLVEADARGLYHLAGAGACSRFELALETLRLAGLDTALEPVTSGEFPTKAARPRNSTLDCAKAARAGVALRDWRESLAEFVNGLETGERGETFRGR